MEVEVGKERVVLVPSRIYARLILTCGYLKVLYIDGCAAYVDMNIIIDKESLSQP